MKKTMLFSFLTTIFFIMLAIVLGSKDMTNMTGVATLPGPNLIIFGGIAVLTFFIFVITLIIYVLKLIFGSKS